MGLWLLVLPLASAQGPAGEGYEEPPVLRASEILPAELLSGPHHQVEEEVGTDGLLPHFSIQSAFGTFEARGDAELRARVREIQALAALNEVDAKAAEATPAPRETDGFGAIPGLALGTRWPASAAAGGEANLDYAKLDTMKRQAAHELGIDPYTENEELQEALRNRVWAAWAGGKGLVLGPGTAEHGSASGRAGELLRDYDAEDLRRLNRLELTAMGVTEDLREEFLKHPSYSPSEGTQLVDALSSLEGIEDRAEFIRAAVGATSSDEAQRFEQIAALMRRYNESTGGIERFVTIGGRVAGYAPDGTLVVPLVADHAAWTPAVASFAESIARAVGEDPAFAEGRTRFILPGTLSARARSELERRGIDVTEQADTPAPELEAEPAVE